MDKQDGDISRDDERAIQAVLIAYATGIDQRDWPLFERCFVADCRADYGDFGVWHSAREITRFMEQAHAEIGMTLHRMTNFSIAPAPGGAAVCSYVDALLLPREAGGPIHRGIGRYEDLFVRDAGQWRIAKRKFHAALIE